MKKSSKIFLIWVIATLVFALLAFYHEGPQIGFAPFLMTSIALLVGIISTFLIVHEANRKNKFLFLNFAIFFLLVIFSFAFNLIAPFLAKIDRYSPFVLVQWIRGANYLALAFAVVYLVIDSLFRDIRVGLKYVVTTLIVGVFFAFYFGDILSDPKYSYSTADVQDFRSVDHEYSALQKANGKVPTPEDIAKQITLPAWRENQPVGKLFPENNILRIKEILPYLNGENYLNPALQADQPVYYQDECRCVLLYLLVLWLPIQKRSASRSIR